MESVSLAEIQSAIDQLSFEERAKLAAWFHGWKDDEWDEQMKRDVAEGKLDLVLHEVEEDIQAGRLRDMP
jgi:hypothetical protein